MPHRPLLALAVLVGAAAPAQDRPSLAPTRDVSIIYRGLGPRPVTLHVSIQASTGLSRVQGPTLHGYGIVDRKAKMMTMVMIDQKMYMVMAIPTAQQRSPELDPTAQFTRKGADTVAGLTCTVWDYSGEQAKGTTCVTEDGVMLRVKDAASGGGMEATEVTFAPLPDADFQPPPDFARKDVALPADAPAR